ncbi:MAG: hypothetical protein ABSE22_08770 [Xanthobacteraceae bacterium]|jgi:hypothetical protein
MLATNDKSHRVLLKALSGQENGYRRWMRPADIIQQSRVEQPRKTVIGFAGWLQKLRCMIRRS